KQKAGRASGRPFAVVVIRDWWLVIRKRRDATDIPDGCVAGGWSAPVAAVAGCWRAAHCHALFRPTASWPFPDAACGLIRATALPPSRGGEKAQLNAARGRPGA